MIKNKTIVYRLALLFILAVWVSIVGSCDRDHAVDSIFNKAESVMNVSPDSALIILRGIDKSFLKSKAEEARYALLMSQALDKNYIDTTDFNVLQPAIDYYLKKGSADEKLRTYYYQGRIYQNRQNNDSAMQSFMRGREYCGQVSDTLTMANLLVAQGTILSTTYKFEDFVEVNLEAAKLYSELGNVEYEILSIANALDGCIVMGNRNRADSIMSIAHNKANRNTEYASAISPYILLYAINFGDREDIINLLDYYDSGDYIDDMTKIDVAQAYCKIGDVSNAKRIVNSVDFNSGVKNSLKYLAVMSEILEKAGDYAGALNAYRDFSTTIDSIHQSIFSHDLLFAKERHEMEKSNLMKLQKRDRVIWLSLCVAFVLLIIAGYIYYRYRLGKTKNLLEEQENKRLQIEQENLKRENDKLELERHNAVLEKQTAELECERQSLVAENLLLKIERLENESASLKEILEKRENLAKPVEEAIKVRIEMLNGLLATQITENDSYAKPYDTWKDKLIQNKDELMNTTRLAFKASHPRFIEYLEGHGLNEYEINYLCLYAIGLKGKEVGNYMQLRRHYNISSEIRSKLGIDEHETNIGIYIRKLLKKL
ncbi:MAG: hypothetical protein K2I92_07685 [Muribaculaceae bacterium]|nr:hypothetical protein [Muribaculaceae bacterium]